MFFHIILYTLFGVTAGVIHTCFFRSNISASRPWPPPDRCPDRRLPPPASIGLAAARPRPPTAPEAQARARAPNFDNFNLTKSVFDEIH